MPGTASDRSCPVIRALIEATARRHAHVLVPEPARRDGGVVVGRYAIARFRVTTRGKSSHAGLRLGEGRSAIREMAHQIIALEGMTDEQAGFNVGIVRGASGRTWWRRRCEAEVLASATTEAKLAEVRVRMQALKPLAGYSPFYPIVAAVGGSRSPSNPMRLGHLPCTLLKP